MLLGRTHHRSRGLRARMMAAAARAHGYAGRPVLWVALEARRLATEAGRRRPGTDDVLLAVLALHEVTRSYPQLTPPPPDGHDGRDGGDLLARAGLRYHDAFHLTRDTDLGTDPHPIEAYLPRLPDDTATVVHGILDGTDNRASRLLARAGITLPLR